MAENVRVIGIEVDFLKELISNAVREEVNSLKEEIKTTLMSKTESLLREERLNTNQVAELFGVTRHTISNYVYQELLPEPKRDLSDRPYWTPEQLEKPLKLRGIKTKYPV